MLVSQTKMVQHIRKKHPEFAQLATTIQTPLTTTVISSAPAVISADGTTAETVVVRKNFCPKGVTPFHKNYYYIK